MDSGTVALIVGLVSAVVGSLGTKILDTSTTKKKINIELANQIRSEQRSELLNLRVLNAEINSEIEDLREKYYKVLQHNVDLESKIDALQIELEEKKLQ